MAQATQSDVGHGALGLRPGLRDFLQFAEEPAGTPQLWAELRLGVPIVTNWEANSGCYRTAFYRAFDGLQLDVVSVMTGSQTLRRTESISLCAATPGTFFYDSAGGSPNAWDSGAAWDAGVLWDVGSWLYVNAPTTELDGQVVIARVGFYAGTDGVTQPVLGPDILTGDGEFEAWTGGIPDGWSVTTFGGGAVSQVSGFYRAGLYSVGIIAPLFGGASVYKVGLPLIDGALYCLSGSYYHNFGTGGGFGIKLCDSSDANIVQADGRTYDASASPIVGVPPAGEWRRWSFYFRSKNTTRLYLFASPNTSGGGAYLDSVRLQRVHRQVRYEPRLARDAAPAVDEGRSDIYYGAWRIGQAALRLANDGLLETMLGQHDTLNGEVLLRQGGRFPDDGEELTIEACRTMFAGRIQSATLDQVSAQLELENTQGQFEAIVPLRTYDKSATPGIDARTQGQARPLLFGYQAGIVPRRVDTTTGGLPVYEVVDTTDWPTGIGVDHAATARYAEVRLYQDEDAAERGDLALSVDASDHVTWDAAAGRFTATRCLKPVAIDEEHQFYTFSFNGGGDLDVRLLDANEETVILTPTATGGNNNFSAVGAPSVHEAVTTFGDSARADSTSTSGVRRCEITCAALTGSAAIVFAELRGWMKTKGGIGDDGDTLRLYVERAGTRYYGTLVEEPAGFYKEHIFRWTTDPSTGAAWTQTDINSAVWGVEYGPNGADYLVVDTLLPYVRRNKSVQPSASRPSIRTPHQHAEMLQQAMLSAAALTSGITVTFDEATFKYTITGSGTVTSLTLKTKTGRQKSGWAAMGYGTDDDQTGQLTYTTAVPYYDAETEIDVPVLRVTAIGFVDDAGGTYTGTPDAPIERAPDVLRFILARLLRVASERIDTASFVAARATAKSIAVYVDEPVELRVVVQRIEQGELSDLVIDGDRYYFSTRPAAWAAGDVELHDAELIGGVQSELNSEGVFGVVRVSFGRDPGRGTWEMYEQAPSTNPRVRFGRSDALTIETYLLEAADAAGVRDSTLELASVPRRIYTFAARGQLLRVRLGQIVRLYPVTGGLSDADGVTAPVDVRIFQRQTDPYTLITTATAVEV